MLIYPGLYLVGTLVAGALGESYPYSFLDVSKIGYSAVAVTGFVFLVIFYALGLATITASRRKRLKVPAPGREDVPTLRPAEQTLR